MTQLSIARLKDHSEALEPVARWIDQQWGAFSGRSPDETRARFAQEYGREGLPTSCIALDGGEILGVATLRERDSVDWDPLATPWICNVYVRAEARGHGVAAELCRALEDVAVDLGYSELHLATIRATNSLYHRLGYVVYRTSVAVNVPMYLMRRQLPGKRGAAHD